MNPAPGMTPLSPEELTRLGALMAARGGEQTMSLPKLDGFLTALIVGPEVVMPSEYLPVVWGAGYEPEFESLEEAQELIGLLMRHWNGIIGELEEHGVYEMLLDEPDERGVPGRQWAQGFMQGVQLRGPGWAEFLTDENEGQIMTIALVSGEVDPGFPREVLSAETAEKIVSSMGAGIGRAYRHFKAQRRPQAGLRRRRVEPVRRATAKVGRNDPCPCGSRRKYKQCCGAPERGLH
jgi:uncharacterized protein